MKFTFEANLYKGECYRCPMCKEREIGSICAIDDCLVATIEDSSECPLKEANEIVWHPYPKEKPTEDGLYLLTCDVGVGVVATFGRWFLDEFVYLETDGKVIAWAEMPKPYKE